MNVERDKQISSYFENSNIILFVIYQKLYRLEIEIRQNIPSGERTMTKLVLFVPAVSCITATHLVTGEI